MYDNALKSNYEELKTYYPVEYRDVLEMDAIWRAFGHHLDTFQAGLVRSIANCFIHSADEETIKKLEDFLYISYDGSRTLDDRRALVASYFIGTGHIGEKEIREVISIFTEREVSVALVGGSVEIEIHKEVTDPFKLSDVMFALNKRLPAHLGRHYATQTSMDCNVYIGGAVTMAYMQTILPERELTYDFWTDEQIKAAAANITYTVLPPLAT